ncbi:UNVERIFIED_CONTAM: hypothetical protein K2H54_023066 [Gekko kuhli]
MLVFHKVESFKAKERFWCRLALRNPFTSVHYEGLNSAEDGLAHLLGYAGCLPSNPLPPDNTSRCSSEIHTAASCCIKATDRIPGIPSPDDLSRYVVAVQHQELVLKEQNSAIASR